MFGYHASAEILGCLDLTKKYHSQGGSKQQKGTPETGRPALLLREMMCPFFIVANVVGASF